MVLLRSEVNDELHGRVEQLGYEDQKYGQNQDRKLELADTHQQAPHQYHDGNHDVEAHVALRADRGDHTLVRVLEASGDTLLSLAWLLNLLRHAAPPLRLPGPWPFRWPRSPPRGPSRSSVARRAQRVPRPLSLGSHTAGRSRPRRPSLRKARPPRS